MIRGTGVSFATAFGDPAVAYVKTVPSGGRNNGNRRSPSGPAPLMLVPFFPALYYLHFGIKFVHMSQFGAWESSFSLVLDRIKRPMPDPFST